MKSKLQGAFKNKYLHVHVCACIADGLHAVNILFSNETKQGTMYIYMYRSCMYSHVSE